MTPTKHKGEAEQFSTKAQLVLNAVQLYNLLNTHGEDLKEHVTELNAIADNLDKVSAHMTGKIERILEDTQDKMQDIEACLTFINVGMEQLRKHNLSFNPQCGQHHSNLQGGQELPEELDEVVIPTVALAGTQVVVKSEPESPGPLSPGPLSPADTLELGSEVDVDALEVTTTTTGVTSELQFHSPCRPIVLSFSGQFVVVANPKDELTSHPLLPPRRPRL
ncbi:hypothetical protein DPEC_G00171710 [Dallia pectoralis]|uniref:Uncharacterized protein n=1 Tax=Dallia pectoralis TaxID=75939 RepID=A0ACC2GD90_DALPE|nr:hypothetical protein DPEC_G00171710 [Dallia pectoralis]